MRCTVVWRPSHLGTGSHAPVVLVATVQADPRLTDCLKYDPEKDNPARKATHWTLRDQGDGDAGRGDGS